MRNFYIAGASLVALGAAIGTANALPSSPRELTISFAEYNAAQVQQANGVLTVPAGLATYSVNPGGGMLEVNSRLTVTLPPGFVFSSQPALSTTGSATFSLAGGGIGAQSIAFQVDTAPIVSGEQVLLQQNLNSLTSSVAPGTSIDFLAFAPSGQGALRTFYTHGGVVPVGNFFTGDDSGYASLLRVNNAGTGPVNLFALVQPDTGGAPLSGSLGVLASESGTVFTESQMASAVAGLNLANSGQRATINLIVTGDFGGVAASTLLVNPSGVVTNVGLASTQLQ